MGCGAGGWGGLENQEWKQAGRQKKHWSSLGMRGALKEAEREKEEGQDRGASQGVPRERKGRDSSPGRGMSAAGS